MTGRNMSENTARIGLQLSEDGAQITWQYGNAAEPQTLSLPGERGDGMMEVPPEVFRQIETGASGNNGAGAGELSPAAEYLSGLLDKIPSRNKVRKSGLRICVTSPHLTEKMADSLRSVFSELGIAERNLFLQDFRTSFFYYVMNKKREQRIGDVALLTMQDWKMKGYILHFDRSGSVRTAQIHEEASSDVSETARAGRSDEDWDQERDRLFYELLGKLFERRNVTASYLYGTYFDSSWAKRSFQYLTFHRHAYQGQNLFSKGACYGAMARTGMIRMPDIVFLGTDIVRADVGIMVRVKGRIQYDPLIRSGVNWYEAAGRCEVVPDGEKNVTILTGEAGSGIYVRHVVRLNHYPDRPNRASRLGISVWFSAPGRMEAEVTDLGFGSMYPPSGAVWHRSIRV